MEERLILQLRNHGYSTTAQRLAVFHALEDGPMKAKDLATIVPADPASVYRAIHVFKRADIVHEVVIGGRPMVELSENFDRHHHHAACIRCGVSVSFEEPRLEAALSMLARRYGLTKAHHSIEITGICSSCRENAPESG